ncbi:MAG TPA: glycosyltransferase [Fimbriiglobus sp.]
MTPRYSIVVPTYRRAEVLGECLACLAGLDYPLDAVEVRVYDNGSPQDARPIVEKMRHRFPHLAYTLNEPGHGLGYSLARGAGESTGDRIVELNDDALVPPDFLTRLDATFAADPNIGVVGVRALESEYSAFGDGIGTFDPRTAGVVGNFHRETPGPVDVDHVYGFCYAYSRAVLARGGRHDRTLLAQDYSSGNRLETDHCLTAKRLGFRVVYDGTLAVRHLAKPRGDMSERSPRWKLNHTRNTLYLYLKHFGPLGRRGLAARFALRVDLGIVSALKHPTRANWAYVWTGFRARASAVYHYGRHLAGA